MNQNWIIKTDKVKVHVQSLGAMMAPLEVEMKSGKIASPLAISPWADESKAGVLPGILQRLRGEWPCIPFGMNREVDLDPDDKNNEDWLKSPHGYASNHHWDLVSLEEDKISLSIEYPEFHPIETLERNVSILEDQTGVHCQLKVYPRRDVKLPIGLHPVFSMEFPAGSLQCNPAEFEFAHTYPFSVSEEIPIFETNQKFQLLINAPGAHGDRIDLSSLPFEEKGEGIVQLCGLQKGEFNLSNKAERYMSCLTWDVEQFPSCLLWVSNSGRSNYPWNSRNMALGIEPVSAFFDQGNSASIQKNLISESGIPTYTHFMRDEVWMTEYKIRVVDVR